MKVRAYFSCYVCGMSLLLSMDGCMPLTLVQSPVVLKPDENEVGIGLPIAWREGQAGNEIKTFGVKIPSVSPFLYLRRGVAENLDAGVKVYGIPYLAGGLSVDLKYEILGDPLSVSGDIDLSLSTLESSVACRDCWFGSYKTIPAITPSVLFGGEHLFGGVRYLILYSSGEGARTYPALLGGVSLGSTFKLIFDINSIAPFREESFNVWNFGLQITWN